MQLRFSMDSASRTICFFLKFLKNDKVACSMTIRETPCSFLISQDIVKSVKYDIKLAVASVNRESKTDCYITCMK